jgi:hypothetical protein
VSYLHGDILITENDLVAINHLKTILHENFATKDLGNNRYFLGLEIAKSHKGFNVSQCKYTLDLISKVGLLGAKPVKTLIEKIYHISYDDEDICHSPNVYRRIIGKLLYLLSTRPDISFIVNHLSQFISKPYKQHYDA